MVRGEVKGCDLVAVRGDELVIVEMKLSLNTQLLIQGVRRQKSADYVYVAVPERCLWGSRNPEGIRLLVNKLGLGLIVVAEGEKGLTASVAAFPR